MPATAAIATPATDAALKRRYSAMGGAAFTAGSARQCRYDPASMIAAFWFQGWDRQKAKWVANEAAGDREDAGRR